MLDDVLKIKNMAFYGYHGLFEEEARLGQKFEVDVEVYGNFRGFAREDLPRGLDYPRVCEVVEQIVTGERFGLIESLADRIADVLQSELGLTKLLVRVRKPNPPVSINFDGVEVEVRRGGEQ